MNRYFSQGREFSLIESLFDPSHFSNTAEGLGDDAFLLRAGGETWAFSTDSSVEGIHYREDWGSLEMALEKALLSNLSDINAMGGRTAFVLFNLGALKAWDGAKVAGLGNTLKQMETRYGFRVVGGDTVTKDVESFFTFTVFGRILGNPLLRSQARPGHRIYVSGRLGDSAAGLAMFLQGRRAADNKAWKRFMQAHLLPSPPLNLGPCLSELPGPVAAIDISDGLSSELWHLSRQSGCRMRIEWGKLDYDQELKTVPGGEAWQDWVLNGGEGYQLLFTGDFTKAELDRIGMAIGSEAVREIGRVEEGEGAVILDESGTIRELAAGGWSH